MCGEDTEAAGVDLCVERIQYVRRHYKIHGSVIGRHHNVL
jgi:hypothetical protein